jgi:hypothetical protein
MSRNVKQSAVLARSAASSSAIPCVNKAWQKKPGGGPPGLELPAGGGEPAGCSGVSAVERTAPIPFV